MKAWVIIEEVVARSSANISAQFILNTFSHNWIDLDAVPATATVAKIQAGKVVTAQTQCQTDQVCFFLPD